MMGLVLVGGGLFSAVCAAMDFDWFMNSRRARLFVMLLGRTGARIFYVGLGVALMVAGVAIAVGTMP